MFCPKCGAKLQPEAKFCQSCGNQIIGAEIPTKPASSQGSTAPNKPNSAHNTPRSSSALGSAVTIIKVGIGLGAAIAIIGFGINTYLTISDEAEKKAICKEMLSKPAPAWPDCAAEQAAHRARARPGEFAFVYECMVYNEKSDRNKYENCKKWGSP